ncbi:protein kinase [Streptomyces sp. NPDC008150]|uniref:protein kinase n=1 Tax=Streptomyces sp. NPDC008150 TaxID=3364816 RepID=UPI0036E0A0A8
MDEYAGRVLADRYRLPLPPSDEYELTETRAFDTYSGQEVLVRQVPLPEVVEAEVLDAEGLPDGFTARDRGTRRAPARTATRRPADPAVRRAVEAAQAAARIPDHPRLDQVFDVFADGGSLWIVSELVPARPLAALLAEQPLTPYRAAEVAADLLMALRVLHAHGWVHRNITARTVLIGDDGRVMLTGLAVGAAEEALCGYDPVPDLGTPFGAPAPQPPSPPAPGGAPAPNHPAPGELRPAVGPGPGAHPGTHPGQGGAPTGAPGIGPGPGTGTGTEQAYGPGQLQGPGGAAYPGGRAGSGPGQGMGGIPDPMRRSDPEAARRAAIEARAAGPGQQQAPGAPGRPAGEGGAAGVPARRTDDPGNDIRAARAGAIAAYRAGARAAARVQESQQGGRPALSPPRQPAEGGAAGARPDDRGQQHPPNGAGTGPDGPQGGPYGGGAQESGPGGREDAGRAGAAGPDEQAPPPGQIADPYGVRGTGTTWRGGVPRPADPGASSPLPGGTGQGRAALRPAPGTGLHPSQPPHQPRPSHQPEPRPGGQYPAGQYPTGSYLEQQRGARPAQGNGPYGPGNGPATGPGGGHAPALPGAPGTGSPTHPGAHDPVVHDPSGHGPAVHSPGAHNPAHPAGPVPLPVGAGVSREPARWDQLVAHAPEQRRGPATALAAERARQARMTVVGPVTERWAPEQAGPVHENWQLAAPIGPATDLWALGALLFRAVQGHAPYPEDSTAELVQMVCAEPPAFAEECGPLRPVVESLLRQDPTERLSFEELRGWLRSLVRSAPEPEAGAHVVPAPPADPARLPVVRRRGELVRRRRAGLPATSAHGRHKRDRQEAGSPGKLGRRLLLTILLVLVAGVAYAMFFLPKADDTGAHRSTGVSGDAGATPSPSGPSAGSSDGASTSPSASPTPTKEKTPSPSATKTQGATPDAAAGFTLRKDPEGFQVAVPKGWTRAGKNSQGQVVYSKGDFKLIVVPGRDSTSTGGSDPMVYQRDKEPELQPYRSSSWATSSGLRTIQVGGLTMAEGQFTWTGDNGSDLFVRNLAILVGQHYHVVQVRGPDSQRDEVTKVYEQASSTYKVTG